MLQVVAMVNNKPIETLLIHNTGRLRAKFSGEEWYEYHAATASDNCEMLLGVENVWHDRNDGWKVLVEKVIKAIERR
jgi:hypothetical protein